MKRQTLMRNAFTAILYSVLCMWTAMAMAQTAVTVETAGTLSSLLSQTESNVKITGPLNGTDMKYLRGMASTGSLATLDLSEARIVSGGVAYYETKTTQNNVLGEFTFYECKKLTSVVLPSTLISIGGNAFARTGLRKIDIPNTVTSVGGDAFAYCSSLATVVVGKRVVKIEKGAFYSSAVTNAYIKPVTPPSVSSYLFSSSPRIHVYSDALADYKSSGWSSYGTFTGDLANTYPKEKDPQELAAERYITYFDDAACTQLQAQYAAMTDEDLTAQMTTEGIPQTLIEAALKVKNNTWKAYEKDFRVHAYKAYSDAAYWNDKLKSTGGSYMGNPTGIYTKEGQDLFVFVSDDIPAGATLYLAGCVENDLITSAKTGTKLEKGVNVIPGIKDALYYVVYTADTKAMTKKLTEWPMMNIHIEGGVVNGYYELSRHSDADYRAILKAATHFRFTVKGDESLFHFKTASFRKAWPTTIDKSICWFDSLTVWEKELMGFCESVAMGKRDYAPFNLTGGEAIFPIYYNNPNFAIEGEEADAGYANSTPYRTSYNSYDCISKSFNVARTDMDDNCAAHECGHNNQGTINLEGCTEVSNNLFSQMIRFIDGVTTTGGDNVTFTFDDHAHHVPFYLRSGNSRQRMFFQLYLYYHQARKNTAFYPTLFQELRKSPITTYQSNNYSGALKFVRTVCKVAQEDLTEFFRVWGFFEPGVFKIEDYGAHTVTARQSDIKLTLNDISKYPKKNTEILFIEDRAEELLAFGFPRTAGQKRNESERVGQCGDLGQFTHYMEENPEPSSYTYLQSDSLFAMKGKGGVGFLVLDSEGNILHGSNAYNFSIPTCVGKDFSIWSVDADGTLHPTEKTGSATQAVAVATAGTLQNDLDDSVLRAIITGPINGTDLKYLRTLNESHSLLALDLSGANIRTGGVSYYKTYRSALNVLGESLFYECKKLQSIALPTSLTRIGTNALARSGIKSLVIPDNVTTINGDACAYCDNLSTVVIGAKVRTIEKGAFYSSAVKDVYVKPTTPPTVNSYLFSSNPTIHVPKASLAKYQASAWKDYGTIVGDLEDCEDVIDAIETPAATVPDVLPGSPAAWYTVSGQRLTEQPRSPGIYIHGGRKQVVR